MTRTLSGHLSDLDLDEIVRVIALSRRSGMLAVEASEGRAELSFVAGRLVRLRMHDAAETLAELLERTAVLDVKALAPGDGALAATEPLDVLVARYALAQNDRGLIVRVDDAIGEELLQAALKVMSFRHGSFLFQVSADPERGDGPLRYLRDTALTLPAGLDGDDLARAAKRARNERKGFTGPKIHAPVGRRTGPDDAAVELVIADEDTTFAHAVERTARDAGVPAVAISGARAAIERLPGLLEAGTQSVMVANLVMPHANGRGILGGLEVLRKAADLEICSRIFLAVEGHHADAEACATAMGCAGIVRKPTLRRGADVAALHAKSAAGGDPLLAPYLNPILDRLRRPLLVAQNYDLAKELRIELGDTQEWRTESAHGLDENTKNLETLKALLGELNNPSYEEEIPLLVLRFVSAFFLRGALFLVDEKKGDISGSGGFGLGVADPGRLVHSIHLPLQADTVFSRCLKERAGVRQLFYDSEWNLRLIQALGGPRPRDVYTAPLISPRGIEGVLYADNATDPRPFPDIHLLEIFLQQAAAALERATLSRQLKRMLALSA